MNFRTKENKNLKKNVKLISIKVILRIPNKYLKESGIGF